MTPASAQLSSQEGGGGGNASGNSTPNQGGSTGGFKPLQAAIAKSAGVVKDRSGALLMRSKSSDRAEGIAATNASLAVPGEVKKKGVMGTVRGLALGQSVSQPAQSRSSTSTGVHHAPIRSSSTHSPLLPPSGTTTPVSEPTRNPLLATSQVHQLAESHVSQISLRMSETVNKVFMPSAHGAAGQQQDKLEGTFFVPTSAVQDATGGKGRPCPRVVKSREFGEMIVA